MATSHTSGRADFFQRIPRRSLLVLHLAVFFIFAPVGMLFVSSFAQQRPLASVVLYMTVSGLVAVCWAATFTISKLFISGIVIFSAALMVLPGPLASTTFGLRSAQVSLVCYMLAAATVLGYFLFIAFIGGQARTTLRLMTEMSLARQIHDALVPTIDVTSDQFEVLGTSIPSTEMGGDLIDLIEHEEGTDMFLADVSGHPPIEQRDRAAHECGTLRDHGVSAVRLRNQRGGMGCGRASPHHPLPRGVGEGPATRRTELPCGLAAGSGLQDQRHACRER
jgi:hypothetical protein